MELYEKLLLRDDREDDFDCFPAEMEIFWAVFDGFFLMDVFLMIYDNF